MASRITVLVDNYAREPGDALAEYGLSLLISSGGFELLYDAGSTGFALLRNAEVLGVNLKSIGHLFLSHRHSDHTGGVPKLLDQRGGEGLTLVAHPDIYEPAIVKSGGSVRDISAPFSDSYLASRGVRRLLVREPLEIARGVWVSGEIPRSWPSHVEGMYRLTDGRLVADEMRDDMAVYLEAGDGFVAITGCGHSGVENIIEQGERLLGKRPIGIIGGLHLLRSDARRIEEVAAYMASKRLELVVPLHCTGPRAHWPISERLGSAYRLSGVGDTITV